MLILANEGVPERRTQGARSAACYARKRRGTPRSVMLERPHEQPLVVPQELQTKHDPAGCIEMPQV